MTKIVCIFFFLTLSLFGSSESVNFDCTYEYYQYIIVDRIYYCYIKHDVTVSSRNEVVSVTGTHLDGLDNDKVDGFWVNSYVDYFPQGWEKYFKNIIFVWMGRFLKEVRPTDLKPFTKAKLFYLIGPIEVLEEGLFDNNPEVEGIFLSDSKLSHIDSNVFDNLSKLSILMLRSNPCISKDTYSKSGVPAVIKAVKNQCINADYAALEEKVKNLQKEVGSAALNEKVKNLEDEVKNSKFAVYFEEKLKSLKNVQ